MKNYGFTRKELRGGSGTGSGVANEHFHDMIGSTEFYVYRHPNRRIKGYGALKAHLDTHGCEVVDMAEPSNPVGERYETIRITNKGNEIPVPLLRRAHSWAHQRNLLHMFYKRG